MIRRVVAALVLVFVVAVLGAVAAGAGAAFGMRWFT